MFWDCDHAPGIVCTLLLHQIHTSVCVQVLQKEQNPWTTSDTLIRLELKLFMYWNIENRFWMLNSFLYPFYTSGEPQRLLLCCPPPPKKKCNIAFSALDSVALRENRKMGQIKCEYLFPLQVDFVSRSDILQCPHLLPSLYSPFKAVFARIPQLWHRLWGRSLFVIVAGCVWEAQWHFDACV